MRVISRNTKTKGASGQSTRLIGRIKQLDFSVYGHMLEGTLSPERSIENHVCFRLRESCQ